MMAAESLFNNQGNIARHLFLDKTKGVELCVQIGAIRYT